MNVQESMDEATVIVDWISKEISNLDAIDQLYCTSAFLAFSERLKPIYEKYNKKKIGRIKL